MHRIATVCLALASLAGVAAAGTYDYADTSGFTIGLFPSGTTPKQFQFPASGGPLDMTRTSADGTGLTLTTRTVTYSGSAPYGNPDWIAGTRAFYGINDSGTAASPIMTFTTAFTAALQSDAFLVFTDVEYGEKIYIKAYNGGSLIPFANLAFTKWNGNSLSGTSVNTTWNSEPGYTGLLASGTPFGFSNPVVTLQSSEPISSLEYTLDMGSATNSLGFNFAVPVPEPAPHAVAAGVAVAAAAWRRLARRRRGGSAGFTRDHDRTCRTH